MNTWQLLLELTLKAILILSVAGLLSVWLRNASAALRHTVWSLALGGLLALPLLTFVVPAWRVAILPAPNHADAGQNVATIAAEEELLPAIAPPAPVLKFEAVPVAAPAPSWTFNALQIALLVWALGAGVVLARLAFGTLRMWRITSEAECLTDYHWSALTNRLRGELDLQDHVSLYASEEIAMPVTWGVLRPVVVLPAESAAWSAEWRRIVLLHELAHIKRRDCLTQMLAQLTCALHWFNPLVWFAAQRLRVERELACDDCVLEVGTRASDYASYLVELAKSFDADEAAPAVTVGMACSQLESRVRAILDPQLKRGSLSRHRKAALALALACALLPLASLQVTSQVKPKPPAPPIATSIPIPPVPPVVPEAPEIALEVSASLAKLKAQQDTLAALQEKAVSGQLSPTEKIELTSVQLKIASMQDELRGTLAMVSPPAPAPVPDPVAAPAPMPLPLPMPMPGVKAVAEISADLAAQQDAQKKDEGLTAENLVQLKMHGVTPEYIEAIKKAGYDDVSVRQIVELKIHGVTPEFIKEAQSMSGEKISARDLVQLKISGVNPQYIGAMKQVGFDNLSIRKLTNLRMMGVTPEYATAMKRIGFDALSADQLTQLKTHGVTEEYVKQVQGWGLGKLSARDVMDLKIHGVKLEDAQTLKALGFDNPTLRDLTQVRMFGVTESYVKDLRGLGFDKLTLRDVIRLKQFGVDTDYVRKMRAAGFKNISANDMIKFKNQGIDAILLKN